MSASLRLVTPPPAIDATLDEACMKCSDLRSQLMAIRSAITEIEVSLADARERREAAIDAAAEDLLAGGEGIVVAGEAKLQQLRQDEVVAARAFEMAKRQAEKVGRRQYVKKMESLRSAHNAAVQRVAEAVTALAEANAAEISIHRELQATNVPYFSLGGLLPTLPQASFPGVGDPADNQSPITYWTRYVKRNGLLGG